VAAEGRDGPKKYPWGNAWDDKYVPKLIDNDRTMGNGPDNVDAHPLGASVYGVEDLIGNVW